jgi:hypothetical protein
LVSVLALLFSAASYPVSDLPLYFIAALPFCGLPSSVSNLPLFFFATLPFSGQESPFLLAADVDCYWDREDTECP